MYKENNYPSVLLEEAVDAICSLPGVGRKGALRLALHLLKQPAENVHHLAASLVRLRDDVHYCSECSMISDGKVCSICSDRTRDHNTICVVETVRDVMSIENTGQYRGVYHVLGGKISPIDGIGPSDLAISRLVERVAALVQNSDGVSTPGSPGGTATDSREIPQEIISTPGSPGGTATDSREIPLEGVQGVGRIISTPVEIIFALSGDVEGETTAFYIYRQLSGFGVRISSIARGLGFGDGLEYADELTLGRSIVNRQEFRP